ncbi:MAG: imidazolonepropionase [Pseudomonadales bacterium]|nr:imidazolonepropionase [Pseudomonadales bacterium]NRA14211.1 imidazolonepropionase [Oceanospirillaceae bacterium]
MSEVDLLISNVNLASMIETADGQPMADYGTMSNTSMGIKGGKIHSFYPPAATLPTATTHIDGNGGWITPGLIDCHTHLVWGGNRAREFEWRLQGISYEEISRRGGGIASTVKATREASDEELKTAAQQRLNSLMAEGVTCVEIKSGYGLSLQHETRLLRIARELGNKNAVAVQTTLLAAHALPPEFSDKDSYIDEICEHIIPSIAELKLADAVDVFCEGIGFSTQQCQRVFSVAKAYNLAIKGHVEQLSDLKGSLLVAKNAGLSADHIEYLQAQDVPALKSAGTVAVLLPGAFYALKEQQLPPIAALREHAVPMAVATDLNPGTSPQASLRLAMNQACVLFGLTPQESLAGVTRDAAKALGLGHCKGQLAVGFDADLVLWDIGHPSELCYGVNLCQPREVFYLGRRR